jgi:hypothetical protein
MPYKSKSTGGSGSGITSNDIRHIIDSTTNPALPVLKLTSDINNGANADTTDISLEEIVTGGGGITSITATDSSSIDFSGNGTTGTPLTAVSKVSATAGNALTINTDGLFVPTATAGGISTNVGQRLFLGTDNKAFEDISGHLGRVYTYENSAESIIDLTKPENGNGNGTKLWEVSISPTNAVADCVLPPIPAGYKYLIQFFAHCRLYNYNGILPQAVEAYVGPSLDNATKIVNAYDMQTSSDMPAGTTVDQDLNCVAYFTSTSATVKPSLGVAVKMPTSNNQQIRISEIHFALFATVIKDTLFVTKTDNTVFTN